VVQVEYSLWYEKEMDIVRVNDLDAALAI
jgi:hypothetical protein